MEFIDYARRGRNTWWLYLVTVAAGLLLTTLLGVAVTTGLLIAGLMPAGDLTTELTTPTHPTVFFTGVGVMFSCLLAGFVLAARLVQAKRFGDIVGAWSWRLFGLAAGAWTAILAAMLLIDFALAPSSLRLTASRDTLQLAGLSLLALAPQTFCEEFIFRGVATQGLLLALKRPFPTALLSGLLFGAMHIPNGMPQAASATVLGVLMALLAIRTGGLAFSSGLHLANNLFGAVIVVSQEDVFRGVAGVFTQSAPQLMWWDTAASSLALAALTAAAWRWNPARAPKN